MRESGSGHADDPVGGPAEPVAARVGRVAVPAGRAGPTGRTDTAPVLVAAGTSAVWAALVSLVPILVLVPLGWLVTGHAAGSAAGAVRFAGAAWLLGHGVPIDTATGPVGLAPLPLTGLIVWRLVRAGTNTARAVGGSRGTALAGALGVAVGYAVLAALAALLVSTHQMTVSPLRALWTAGLLALVGALAGAVRQSGMAAHIAGQLPPAVRYGLRGGVVATFALLAAGALVAGAALAVHANDAADTLRAYRTGPVGDIGVSLVCAAYLPTLAVWAVSYLAGPGFAVGTGTTVGIGGVHLGPVPALPVLAGLPTGAAPAAGTLLLGVPVLVGVCTGLLIARRRVGTGLVPLLLATALAGAFAGGLSGIAGFLAGGSLGAGRLAVLGPSWWQLGLAVAGLIGVAAMIAATAGRLLAGVGPRRWAGRSAVRR